MCFGPATYCSTKITLNNACFPTSFQSRYNVFSKSKCLPLCWTKEVSNDLESRILWAAGGRLNGKLHFLCSGETLVMRQFLSKVVDLQPETFWLMQDSMPYVKERAASL